MAVEAKCMNGHTFEVTPELVDVTKAGTSFKATCPECRAPAQLSHKKVIEILGLKDNNEARELKAKMARDKNGEPTDDVVEIPSDDEPDVEEDNSGFNVFGGTPTPSPMMQELASADARLRGVPPPRGPTPTPSTAPIQQPVRRPVLDVMGSAATVREKNDVLRDTLESTNLPDNVKQKVERYMSLRPEGLAPHELYSVLTYLGIGNSPATAVVRAYEFELSLQQQEIDQDRQIFNLLGAAAPGAFRRDASGGGGSDYPGMGNPFSTPPTGPSPSGGFGNFGNPSYAAPQRPSGGFPGTPSTQSVGGGRADPQIDAMALMPLLAQHPDVMRVLMANPALMQAATSDPMVLFQVIQAVGATKSQPAGVVGGQSGVVTKDDVKALVGEELGEIKKMLADASEARKGDALIEAMRQNQQFLFEIMKSQQQVQQPAPSRHDDPFVIQQTQIVSALLENLLSRQDRDNTGVLLQAIDELKKNQGGLGSGSQSIEGMNLFLRYQELANQMDETRQRFQDEREKRESLKDIVSTAAETIGDTIADVIQKGIGGSGGMGGLPGQGGPMQNPMMVGRGGMRPPSAPPRGDDDVVVPNRGATGGPVPPTPPTPPRVPPTSPTPEDVEGITTLGCLNCGAPIYVPDGANAAECPACHERFKIDRNPADPEPPVAPTPAPAPEPVVEEVP